ncbi:MAG: c-type cytochrome domain-containing protein [Verrucomicrobiales bacterium]
MTAPGIVSSGGIALTLFAVAMAPSPECWAAPADDGDFAALQANAQKSFQEGITPFVTTYCLDCHGNKKSKGGLNFQPALKHPGDSASTKRWMQAFVNVNAHDMPPEEEDKQPTEEERQKFLDSIGQIKYLSPKDPGPFVIRRLTKVEYGKQLA